MANKHSFGEATKLRAYETLFWLQMHHRRLLCTVCSVHTINNRRSIQHTHTHTQHNKQTLHRDHMSDSVTCNQFGAAMQTAACSNIYAKLFSQSATNTPNINSRIVLSNFFAWHLHYAVNNSKYVWHCWKWRQQSPSTTKHNSALVHGPLERQLTTFHLPGVNLLVWLENYLVRNFCHSQMEMVECESAFSVVHRKMPRQFVDNDWGVYCRRYCRYCPHQPTETTFHLNVNSDFSGFLARHSEMHTKRLSTTIQHKFYTMQLPLLRDVCFERLATQVPLAVSSVLLFSTRSILYFVELVCASLMMLTMQTSW